MKRLFWIFILLGVLPVACSNTISTPSAPNPAATATPTTTGTPTFTVPMGLSVAGSFQRLVTDASLLGAGQSTSIWTTIGVSINHTAETTDTIVLNTPIEGAVPVTYTQSTTLSGVPVAEYSTSFQYTYVPNGTYTMSVSTSLGTVASAMSAPGGITFDATGASVTAVYPGNYDIAVVQRDFPSPVTVTYLSPVGVNIGSPFTYPVSAYSSPATFVNGYAAALTVTAFTGPAAPGSAFVGTDQLDELFAR